MANKAKTRDTDFLFISSMLAAREVKMLTREKANRMLDAATFEECAKLLTDCGYEDMTGLNAVGIDKALAAHRAAIVAELAKMTPCPELIDVFRMKYDYHNAKVLIKAQGVGESPDRLLSDAGRIDAQTLKTAFESGNMNALPDTFATAMQDAAGILARTGNPQLADIRLDTAYFAEMSAMADELGDDFITGWVRLQIDTANLRTLVRVLRMKKGEDFLRTALISGGTVSVDSLLGVQSGDDIANAFHTAVLSDALTLAAAAAGGGDLTSFELACDNALTAYLAGASLKAFGAAAVIRYLARLENEITAARMILTGRLAGIAPDVIRERVRDIC